MKEFSKKTIALIYLAIFLFSFFVPIQKTFAQTPKVPTITLTASPGTINSNGNTTITAKIDQSSIAKFAQKSNSVTFSSSPTVKGFDGTKCDTSERFTGQIWDCTVRFQSSTITKTTYTISASFVLGDKTYYAQPIKVEICGISEALDKGFCIEQGYGTVTLSTNPNPPTIAPGQQVQVTATVSATKGGQVISFFTNEDKKTCNIPTSTQAKNQSCSVVFTDTSFEERTFRVNANIYVDQNHFAKSDPIVDNNINGVDVTVKNPYTVMTVTPKTPTETKYTLLAPIGDFKEIETQKNDTDNPCPFGKYLNIMIRIIIGICAVLAMIMIVAGGIEYMTSELISSKEAGKERILHAILGLVIALGAYTILNTLNPQLLNACLNDLPKAEITIVPLANGSYSSTGGMGGSCTVPTDPKNACIPKTLASTCFANRATEASKICNVESGNGNSNAESGSDLLNNGAGPSYSVGLWQINLTVNDVGGLGCPSAFSGKCGPGTATPSNSGPFVGGPKVGNCSQKVINQDLYKKCVAAAKDTIKNTQAACKIYKENGNNFKPWSYTANKCSIPI